MADVANTNPAESMASPIERAVRALEAELIGHVDPETHAMSEYGIARMAVTLVLQAIREPSEAAATGIDRHFYPSGADARTIWVVMIDKMLEDAA